MIQAIPAGYIALKQAGDEYGVCYQTVRNWVRAGKVRMMTRGGDRGPGRRVYVCIADMERMTAWVPFTREGE